MKHVYFNYHYLTGMLGMFREITWTHCHEITWTCNSDINASQIAIIVAPHSERATHQIDTGAPPREYTKYFIFNVPYITQQFPKPLNNTSFGDLLVNVQIRIILIYINTFNIKLVNKNNINLLCVYFQQLHFL